MFNNNEDEVPKAMRKMKKEKEEREKVIEEENKTLGGLFRRFGKGKEKEEKEEKLSIRIDSRSASHPFDGWQRLCQIFQKKTDSDSPAL